MITSTPETRIQYLPRIAARHLRYGLLALAPIVAASSTLQSCEGGYGSAPARQVSPYACKAVVFKTLSKGIGPGDSSSIGIYPELGNGIILEKSYSLNGEIYQTHAIVAGTITAAHAVEEHVIDQSFVVISDQQKESNVNIKVQVDSRVESCPNTILSYDFSTGAVSAAPEHS